VSKEGNNEGNLVHQGRATARELFMSLYENDWRRKRKREVMREAIRLSHHYPDVYEEILEHFGLPVLEWRAFKEYVDSMFNDKNNKRSQDG
jgi:hypothetical protein